MPKLKTIFFGTPEVSVPFLELTSQLTDVQLVVTQADKPRGRGMEVTPCPVKKRALELGLRVLSPEKLNDIYEDVKNTAFELGVAVAYGKLFRPNFLELPKLGILNVHFSLLPLLRGAAPVQHALFNNYQTTGVSVFWINPGLDDGPLFLQKPVAVAPQDDAHALFAKLIPLGVDALNETLTRISNGELIKTPQTGEPTFAPSIPKEAAVLSFSTMTADELHHKVRGLACGPKPKVPVMFNDKPDFLQLVKTAVHSQDANPSAAPGCVLTVERERGILVKCKQGSIWIIEVHPAGKKPMSAADFANGRNIKPGSGAFILNV